MTIQITKKQSNTFWQMKALAIFTVLFAHMPGHEMVGNDWMVYFFNIIGMFGVPLFMMISGFFNYGSKFSLIKALKGLFVPLLIWGSFCFILHIIKTPSHSPIIDWIMFIIGSKSIFYFVPMLFCCILFSQYINEWVLLLLGFISLGITNYTEIIPYNNIWTYSLNPLNFIVYFSMGRLFRKYDVIEYFRSWWTVLAITIMSIFLYITKPSYFSPWTPLFTMSLFLLSYCLCSKITIKLLIEIGKISFTIYLCHIQIAGAVQAFYKPFWGTLVELTKVIVAFAIVCTFCLIFKHFLSKFHLSKVEAWLGYR